MACSLTQGEQKSFTRCGGCRASCAVDNQSLTGRAMTGDPRGSENSEDLCDTAGSSAVMKWD